LKKLILLLFHLLPILSFGQKLIIDKNNKHFEQNNFYDFYECKESEYQFEEGLASIDFINTDTIYIKNETNTGYSGKHISFKIDKKLNVFNLEYYTWDDLENGSSTDFSIQEFKIILNKNPFESGIKYLKGFYSLKIKSDFDPGEIISDENIEPKTEIFIYRGSFECNK